MVQCDVPDARGNDKEERMREMTALTTGWRSRLATARDALASFDLFTALAGATATVMASVSGGTLAYDMTDISISSGLLAAAAAALLLLRKR